MEKSYSELPLNLMIEYERNKKLLELGQHQEALEGYRSIYEQLLRQVPAKRYHKGGVLHNMGVAAHYLGDSDKALYYLLLAYIEDLLSQKKGEEDNADALPACTNLKRIYGVNANLELLKQKVKEIKENNEVVHDPNDILKNFKGENNINNLLKKTQKHRASKAKRKPGQFKSDWAKRVFIGGSYAKHISEINQIKDICRQLGFDPVVASDFEDDGKIHHHALMLLHECSRAIFEVTDEVGQLMEIERVRDYGVKALFLCQKNAYHSAMITALFKWQGHKLTKYARIEELDKVVRTFLKQNIS